MSIFTANVWGTTVGKGVDLPYIKKAGDTATGLIVFDGGIETNVGTSTFNGPAIFNDDVTLNPSSTLYIDGEVDIAGPRLTVTSDLTEFNGAHVVFNSTVTDFNEDIYTNKDVYFTKALVGNGPQAFIYQDPAVVTTSSNEFISSEFVGTVRVEGNFELYDTQMTVEGSSDIRFSDNTTQDSAYTGAGALHGTYGPVQMTVDTNGKITALSNAAFPSSVPSLSTDNLQIPIGGVNMNQPQLGGLNLQVGNGATQSFSGTGNIISTLVESNYAIAKKGFVITLGSAGPIDYGTLQLIKCLKFRVTFTYFGPDDTTAGAIGFGETTFNIDFFPSQWTQPIDNSTTHYSLSNSIGGQTTFGITSSSIAPNGRQYWVYNKQFQTITQGGFSGWLVPVDYNTWLMTFYVLGDDASSKYNYSACIETLDCTSALINGYGCGIQVIDINS
jgi:hypothetical protein